MPAISENLTAALDQVATFRQAVNEAGAECLNPDLFAEMKFSTAALQHFSGRPITELRSLPLWSHPLRNWHILAIDALLDDLTGAMIAAVSHATRLNAAGAPPADAPRLH